MSASIERCGVREVIDLDLDPDEQAAFDASVATLREVKGRFLPRGALRASV